MRELKKELEEEIVDMCSRHIRFMLIDLKSILAKEMYNMVLEEIKQEIKNDDY